MKNIISIGLTLITSLALTACGGSEGAKTPGGNAVRSQTLTASGECVFEACGAVPSSLESSAKVECSGDSADSCGWSAAGDDTSVSYRACDDSECPARPNVECPADTVTTSQQCGSENDAPCTWTTVCVPPREITPCPEPRGCDSQPLQSIGIICSDGSNGDFACVTDGTSCYWERNCD